MAIPSKQVGWNETNKLLWNISKQLERLIQVSGKCCVTTTTTQTPIVQVTTTTTATP
jgi:hypothetical protein